MCTSWKIPREMSNSQCRGLEFRLNYHLQLKTEWKGYKESSLGNAQKSMVNKRNIYYANVN